VFVEAFFQATGKESLGGRGSEGGGRGRRQEARRGRRRGVGRVAPGEVPPRLRWAIETLAKSPDPLPGPLLMIRLGFQQLPFDAPPHQVRIKRVIGEPYGPDVPRMPIQRSEHGAVCRARRPVVGGVGGQVVALGALLDAYEKGGG